MVFLSLITLLILPFSALVGASFCLGGMTFLLPQGYFLWQGFRHAGAHEIKKIFWDFCKGQIFKLVLTGLIFLLIFTKCHPAIIPYFIGFLMMQMSLWLMML
ncbi:MAG: hypothetical protein A3I12_00580 [Gammaproteobacteria bacterium RIFCSPLOWO2_02_FULL_38_11]|nr:MAG: hypothetical protein A3I12_00580 [Gammaproteobacteria bacterium RIFCSPLOWO2_02_FULL_38_11]OGT76224.1 MAG: hypothetical protein A3G71_00780 [Gammaproteobacteria bacterium RIFCSPLOWO2_12_FULL_38_14]